MLHQIGVLPPPPVARLVPPYSAETQQSVFDTLRLLTPFDMVGVDKIRIGGAGDGGYVLVDQLDPRQPVLSLGIGPTVTFDHDLATRGHHIVMFDHTIAALPQEHRNFTWHKLGVAAEAQPEASLATLAELVGLLPASMAEPILKMDVEGAEWEVLAAVEPALLRRFTQITLELHTLLQLHEPEFNALAHAALTKLVADFVPVHVHGNNFGALGFTAGLACPDTLEVTLVRRDLAITVRNATWYPTALDTPNWDETPDHRLWFFPFAPTSHTSRIDAPELG